MYLLEQAHWALLAALKERGTLSAASVHLGITQSAATQRLREAERRLGVPLTRKQGRRLALTPAGETLAQTAQATQPRLQQAESEAVWQGKRSARRLRLCVGHFDAPAITLGLMQACRQAAPAFSVEVSTVAGDWVARTVADGAADLALAPETTGPFACTARPLVRDRLMAVFPGASPAPAEAVLPAAFADLPYLTYGLRPQPGWEYERFFDQGRTFPGEVIGIESTDLICRMVADGMGASILPKLCVDQATTRDRLAVRELGNDPIQFTWQLLLSTRAAEIAGDLPERFGASLAA
ncbi:MAG: LysR family transcriptional regulator [Pseudomonadota bacterium]